MMKEQQTILAVDDSGDSLALLMDLLSHEYTVRVADSGELALVSIDAVKPDLILLDIEMAGIDGLEVCRRLKASEKYADIPVILISGYADSEKRTEGLLLGAADFINKPFQSAELLVRIKLHLQLRNDAILLEQQADSLRASNEILKREIEKRQRAEDELCIILERSEQSRRALLSALEEQKLGEIKRQELLRVVQQEKNTLSALISGISDEVWFTDKNMKFTLANPAARHEFKLKDECTDVKDLISILEILRPDGTPRPMEEAPAIQALAGKVIKNFEEIVRTPATGELRYRQVNSNPLTDADGRITGVVSIVRDITDLKTAEQKQRHIEEQLRQSQKLEAIGQLSSGVAHDFNNLLGGILGNTELILMSIDAESPLVKYLQSIVTSCKRASTLTQQLLTFARKAPVEMHPVAVNDIVHQVVTIFERTIDKRIEITTRYTQKPEFLYGDQNLLENALLNIAINARDAMPNGGTIAFTAQRVVIDAPKEINTVQVAVGVYIKIVISDTGIGIPKEIKERIFEPFFTTKDVGKGTGLGLASVYGCVKLHKGYILVDSTVGVGTRFELYLPVATDDYQETTDSPDIIHGTGTLLVIDDECVFHSILTDLFNKLGYEVHCYADGTTAIDFYKQNSKKIDAIILDINMPRMNGLQCYRELKKINPDVQVIVASGYGDNEERIQLQKEGVLVFIQKPFKITDLSVQVAKIVKH